MDIKLSDVKEPRRAELWGIIIVTCFNFAFLIAAATHTADIGYNGYLAFAAFLLLFFAARPCPHRPTRRGIRGNCRRSA